MSTDRYTADSPLLVSHAPNAASIAPRVVRSIMARPHGEYNEVDIAGTIVPAYFAVCASVGLDAVMLIAQMIHETGNLNSWWSQRPRRNPAGIGVTGRTRGAQPPTGTWQAKDGGWVEGVAFRGWKDESIPAHAGRLLAYALSDEHATPAQLELIKRALGWRALPASFRGVAPTWRGLNGRWAVPGTTYADKIAAIANRLMEG